MFVLHSKCIIRSNTFREEISRMLRDLLALIVSFLSHGCSPLTVKVRLYWLFKACVCVNADLTCPNRPGGRGQFGPIGHVNVGQR